MDGKAYFLMTMVAPNRKLSTSSDKMPSIIPRWLRFASSASASPGACRKGTVSACLVKGGTTHHEPFVPKGLYNRLHSWHQRMGGRVDPLAPLVFGAFGSVKDKQRQERGMHEGGTSKEEGSQLRVFALASILCMEKPYACIDTNAETPKAIGVGLEALDDSEFGERASLACGANDLQIGEDAHSTEDGCYAHPINLARPCVSQRRCSTGAARRDRRSSCHAYIT